MAFDSEPVLGGHLIPNCQQFVALELNEFAAARAVQVVVLRVAVIVVINGAAVELETVQQPRIDAFTQRPVHGRRADVVRLATARETFDQFLSIKVIVLAEDLFDQELPLCRLPLPSRLEILRETLLGGKRDFQGSDFGFDRFGLTVDRFGGRICQRAELVSRKMATVQREDALGVSP